MWYYGRSGYDSTYILSVQESSYARTMHLQKCLSWHKWLLAPVLGLLCSLNVLEHLSQPTFFKSNCLKLWWTNQPCHHPRIKQLNQRSCMLRNPMMVLVMSCFLHIAVVNIRFAILVQRANHSAIWSCSVRFIMPQRDAYSFLRPK